MLAKSGLMATAQSARNLPILPVAVTGWKSSQGECCARRSLSAGTAARWSVVQWRRPHAQPIWRQLSLSRLNHRLPRDQVKPKIMQRTADFHHLIADVLLPQAKPIFDNATALDTTVDMLDPKTALIHRPICALLIRR